MRKILFIVIIFISLMQPVYPYTGDIERIDDKNYFPEVKKLLCEAKKSIYVTMYLAIYNPDTPRSLSNQLLNELVLAQKRGVEVRVILDQEKVSLVKGQSNNPAYSLLKDADVRVDYDEPSRKTHSKLIIIDEKTVVIGSHNWSDSALKKHRETTVVIECPELARGYIEWIQSIPLFHPYTPLPQSNAPNVYLPYQFLANPQLGIKLYARNFTFYLYLLKKWEEAGHKTFMLDYYDAAKFIGWDKYSRRTYRKMINKALQILHKKFKLVSYKTKRNKPAEIELLDYKNARKKFVPDPIECFIIPGAFWRFGWTQKLSRNAKYFYLIALLETKLSPDPKGWWSCSQNYIYKKYHLGSHMLSEGIEELRRYNLLRVIHSPRPPSSAKHSDTNRYLLLPLYSWEWLQQELEKLSSIYGEKKLTQARRWAEVLLEENNIEVIEKLINYANLYGESTVQYAIDKVAGNKIDSPRRCFAYVEGIILRRAKTANVH